MEETIPQDLVSLKRPVLQKLCKKFGIKANKKNVDLIKALEELRDSTCLILHNTENISHLPKKTYTFEECKSPFLADSTVPSPDRNKEGERNQRQFGSNESSDDLKLSTSCSGDTPLSLSGVLTKSSEAWLNISTESPNLCNSQDHESSSCVLQNVQKLTPLGHKRKHSDSSFESHTAVTRNSQSFNESCEFALKDTDSDPILQVCNEQPPFSPPASSDELQTNSKRKRNPTYTLIDEENETETHEAEQPPLKKVRRATFSLSPKIIYKSETYINITDENADSNSTCISGGGGPDDQVLSSIADVHTEIMNLLDKRVEEKLADPQYQPVFSASESLSKNQPKTSTAKKFDSAHKKHFSRMRSIVSYQHEKEKRTSSARSGGTPHAAKRPKLMEKPLPTHTCTSKIPKATFKPCTIDVKHASFNFTDKKQKATTTKSSNIEFKPMVTSVNEATFKFAENKSRKSSVVTKNPGKCSGSDGKAFMFTAKIATSAKKSQFDINKSLKKKPIYKPHTGKLPDFNISRY